jgi:hypothetical protein
MLFARSILCNLQRLYFFSLPTRETKEGWPLLTVETDVNGDSKTTNLKETSLVGLGLSCRYKRFLFSLGCSGQPSTNIFFLTVHFFNSFAPIAQLAGQAAVMGHMSLSMCLCFQRP